jgi:hypothetical protein
VTDFKLPSVVPSEFSDTPSFSSLDHTVSPHTSNIFDTPFLLSFDSLTRLIGIFDFPSGLLFSPSMASSSSFCRA